MTLLERRQVKGYECSKPWCDETVEGEWMESFEGRDHYRKIAERRGWTFWRSRSVYHYCPNHRPKLGSKMERMAPLAVLVVLLLSGCGGDSPSAPVTVTEPATTETVTVTAPPKAARKGASQASASSTRKKAARTTAPARRTGAPGATAAATASRKATTTPTARRATAAVTATRPATPSPAEKVSVYYPNCDAVKAAGKAPLRRGEPGYRSGLDRDGDGTACDR